MLKLDDYYTPRVDVQVAWSCPQHGWFKLNTDRVVHRESLTAGCGGLIRDENGCWVLGFHRFLGICSVLMAEAWGLLEGLTLAVKIGVGAIEIECDSLVLVNSVRRGVPSSSDIHIVLTEVFLCLRLFALSNSGQLLTGGGRPTLV